MLELEAKTDDLGVGWHMDPRQGLCGRACVSGHVLVKLL